MVLGCFEDEDAPKAPKRGSSMDRGHQDLSVLVQSGHLGHQDTWVGQQGDAKKWGHWGALQDEFRTRIIIVII